MASGLVLTAPEDLPELTEFLLGVFHASPGAPFVQPELMRWKYFTPHPDWAGPRSYLMRDETGRIFAHGCVAPVTFRPPTVPDSAGPVTGMRVIDWAGGRQAPAAGVRIMRHLAALTDTVLATGGSFFRRSGSGIAEMSPSSPAWCVPGGSSGRTHTLAGGRLRCGWPVALCSA